MRIWRKRKTRKTKKKKQNVMCLKIGWGLSIYYLQSAINWIIISVCLSPITCIFVYWAHIRSQFVSSFSKLKKKIIFALKIFRVRFVRSVKYKFRFDNHYKTCNIQQMPPREFSHHSITIQIVQIIIFWKFFFDSFSLNLYWNSFEYYNLISVRSFDLRW